MKIWQTQQMKEGKENFNGGYLNIHDDGSHAERKLYIEDDEGNRVILKNEQIGELYKRIKPILA